MATTIYPTVPVAQPEADTWPVDDHPIGIQADEMLARHLDTGFAGEVRTFVHDPDVGLAGQEPEAALIGIAEAAPKLEALKERYLAQAIGPRQRTILEPLIDRRLDRATGEIGRIAQQATSALDDRIVAERIADLQQDAALSWHDPARLRLLGRSAVNELRYQGERRGWDESRTDGTVRQGLSDLYAGAVEQAIGQDPDRAAKLYEHAREVIEPERQAAVERRIERAREERRVTEIVSRLAETPDDPTRRPDFDDYQARALELTPPDASPETRAEVSRMARLEHAQADWAWQAARGRAAVAALDWLRKNPGSLCWRCRLTCATGSARRRRRRWTGRWRTAAGLSRTRRFTWRSTVWRCACRRHSQPSISRSTGCRSAIATTRVWSGSRRRSWRAGPIRPSNGTASGGRSSTRRCARPIRTRTVRAATSRAGGDVARGRLDHLLGAFEAVQGRPPTMADIRGLVDDALPRGEGDPNIVRTSGGERFEANGNTQIAQQQEPAEPGQKVAPPTEPAPGSPESRAATAKTATDPGKRVVLPNGKNVPSFEDPKTEFLMSPVEDLSEVAAAGQETHGEVLKHFVATWFSKEEAKKYARELVRRDLAQGGRFDYQRGRNPDGTPGYLQLRQFRDVSNFNVGLYMQQTGYLSLPEVLKIAGEYAKEHSSNYMPGEPYGLDPRVKRWIERGYAVGESGVFNKPFHLNSELNP